MNTLTVDKRRIFDARPGLTGLALLLLLVNATPARAATQELRLLHEAVTKHVQRAWRGQAQAAGDIQVQPRIDTRLRLQACGQIESFTPPGRRLLGGTVVGLRCRQAASWKIYVPTEVHVYADVVVAAQPLGSNTPLRASDVRLQRRDLGQLSQGYFQDAAQVIDHLPRRSLVPGTALHGGNLQPPRLVRRGQTVTIQVRSGALDVRMSGKALQNGTRGEQVKVRNTLSKRVISGKVTAAATVQVDL